MFRLTKVSLFLFLPLQSFSQSLVDCQVYKALHQHDVIAFGEASHGSYTDYELRTKMIHCLVANGEAVDVLIEMPHYAGIAIKDYYAREIDVDSLLKTAMYYGLQTNAFIDFVDQFKGNELVTFHGIDMQSHRSTLHFLSESITELNPELATQISPIIDTLNFDFLNGFSNEQYQQQESAVDRNLNHLMHLIASIKPINTEFFWTIEHPFTIVQQYFKMIHYVKHDLFSEYNLYRDSCMAQNTISIREFSKTRIVLIAANAHVLANNSSKYPMMGGHLKNEFNKNYFVIASQYFQGSLLEVDVINQQRVILERKLAPPIKSSLSYKISRHFKPQSDTLINVSNCGKKGGKLFSKKVLAQDMGTGTGGQTYKAAGLHYFRPEEFDAIYFIPLVRPSLNLAPHSK